MTMFIQKAGVVIVATLCLVASVLFVFHSGALPSGLDTEGIVESAVRRLQPAARRMQDPAVAPGAWRPSVSVKPIPAPAPGMQPVPVVQQIPQAQPFPQPVVAQPGMQPGMQPGVQAVVQVPQVSQVQQLQEIDRLVATRYKAAIAEARQEGFKAGVDSCAHSNEAERQKGFKEGFMEAAAACPKCEKCPTPEDTPAPATLPTTMPFLPELHAQFAATEAPTPAPPQIVEIHLATPEPGAVATAEVTTEAPTTSDRDAVPDGMFDQADTTPYPGYRRMVEPSGFRACTHFIKEDPTTAPIIELPATLVPLKLQYRRPLFYYHIPFQGDYISDVARIQGEVPFLPPDRFGLDPLWNRNSEVYRSFDPQKQGPKVLPCAKTIEAMAAQKATMLGVMRPWQEEEDGQCMDNMIYVTTMREPISRIIDFARSEGITGAEVITGLLYKTYTFKRGDPLFKPEMACWGDAVMYQHFDNFVTRLLNGPKVFFLPPGEISFEHQKVAIDVLRKFHRVQVDEEVLDEWDSLVTVLKWKRYIKPSEVYLNSKWKFPFKEKGLALLRKRNAIDIGLYTMVRDGKI
mmetsp:Transcript_2318/g.4851  ORF Transcript_2318/g.4851 Transcript_2318/m.4851 type:complete len:574 (+) Transcript_2318:131-1852(+)